jgi:hypothetical protein
VIRRAIVVFMLTAAMLIGSSAVASAGEICVRPFPRKSSATVCLPTWVLE